MLALKWSSSWFTAILIWDKSKQRSLWVPHYGLYSTKCETGALNRHTWWNQAGDSGSVPVCIYLSVSLSRIISRTPLIRFSVMEGSLIATLWHFKITLFGWRWVCIAVFIWLVSDWPKWGLHHSVGTTCVSVVLFIVLTIQLAIRHSSRSGTGAVRLNAEL